MRRLLIGLVLLVGAAMALPADASIILLDAQPESSWSIQTRVSGFTFNRVEVTSLDPLNNLKDPYLDTFASADGISGPFTPYSAGEWSVVETSEVFNVDGVNVVTSATASGTSIGGDGNPNSFSWITRFNNDIAEPSQWQITLYDDDGIAAPTIVMDGVVTWEDGNWRFGCVCPADDVVPEPSTFIIWSCLGLGGMGLNVWRRRKSPRLQTADRVANVAWSDDTRSAVRAIIDRGRLG